MSSITRHWFLKYLFSTMILLPERYMSWWCDMIGVKGIRGIRCQDMSSQICMRIYCAHSCTNRTSDGISWSVELIWFFPRSSSSAVLVLRGQCIVDSGWRWTCYEARIFNCQQQAALSREGYHTYTACAAFTITVQRLWNTSALVSFEQENILLKCLLMILQINTANQRTALPITT